MNKKFLPKDVYFGEIAYDMGVEGFYFSFNKSFVKIENEGETFFKEISNKGLKYRQYSKDTDYCATVKDKICLADMMTKEKINTPISTKLISLYLLKYTLLSSKKEKKVYNDYAEEFKKRNSR